MSSLMFSKLSVSKIPGASKYHCAIGRSVRHCWYECHSHRFACGVLSVLAPASPAVRIGLANDRAKAHFVRGVLLAE